MNDQPTAPALPATTIQTPATTKLIGRAAALGAAGATVFFLAFLLTALALGEAIFPFQPCAFLVYIALTAMGLFQQRLSIKQRLAVWLTTYFSFASTLGILSLLNTGSAPFNSIPWVLATVLGVVPYNLGFGALVNLPLLALGLSAILILPAHFLRRPRTVKMLGCGQHVVERQIAKND